MKQARGPATVFESIRMLPTKGSSVNALFSAKLTEAALEVLEVGPEWVGRLVVVKFAQSLYLESLQKEASVICYVRHPNLVYGLAPKVPAGKAQDFLLQGFDSQAFYEALWSKGWMADEVSKALVMEFVGLQKAPQSQASSLADFGVAGLFEVGGLWGVPATGRLPLNYLRFVRLVCLQAFRGLAFLHTHTPIIHGDIKPDNLLLRIPLYRGSEDAAKPLDASPDALKLIHPAHKGRVARQTPR